MVCTAHGIANCQMRQCIDERDRRHDEDERAVPTARLEPTENEEVEVR